MTALTGASLAYSGRDKRTMQATHSYTYIETIRADLFRYHRASGLCGFLKCYFSRPGFCYTFWMRTASALRSRPILKLAYILACFQLRRLEVIYGISIPHTTKIGPGLFIGHFGGIVVNEGASIGHDCNLSHGVTIGQKNRGRYKGCPSIGDLVFIGPGACVIGGVSVGSRAAVGAHAVVVRDVHDDEVVAGNPAKVISQLGSRDYVNWVLDEDGPKSSYSSYERCGLQGNSRAKEMGGAAELEARQGQKETRP